MGAVGFIRTRKAAKKKSSKTAKPQKIGSQPSKPKNFHIPVIKTLINPIQSVTSGAYRDFAAFQNHNCLSDRKKTGTKIGKIQNHIGYQIWKPIWDFYEYW